MNCYLIFARAIPTIMIASLAVSCSEFGEPKNTHQLDINEVNSSVSVFSRLAASNATHAAAAVKSMNQSIAQFLSSPTDQNRQSMGAGWKNAHTAFLAISTGTFTESSSEDALKSLAYRLDAWPIQPGYIDSIEYYPTSGIVNDITVDLSTESLRQQHGFSDAEEIILGFHPLEYLIFANGTIDYQLSDQRGPVETSSQGNAQSGNIKFETGPGFAMEDNPDSGSDAIPAAEPENLQIPVRRRRTLLDLLGTEIEVSLNQYVSSYIEDIPDSNSVADSQNKAADLVFSLLSIAHEHASMGFEESNLMLVSDESHSQFSQTSHQNISLRLDNLAKIINEPVWLSHSLKKLDMKIEQDLQTTLAQGNLIIENNQFNESDRARLPTIFSALRHQLEDLQLVITNPYTPDQDHAPL